MSEIDYITFILFLQEVSVKGFFILRLHIQVQNEFF